MGIVRGVGAKGLRGLVNGEEVVEGYFDVLLERVFGLYENLFQADAQVVVVSEHPLDVEGLVGLDEVLGALNLVVSFRESVVRVEDCHVFRKEEDLREKDEASFLKEIGQDLKGEPGDHDPGLGHEDLLQFLVLFEQLFIEAVCVGEFEVLQLGFVLRAEEEISFHFQHCGQELFFGGFGRLGRLVEEVAAEESFEEDVQDVDDLRSEEGEVVSEDQLSELEIFLGELAQLVLHYKFDFFIFVLKLDFLDQNSFRGDWQLFC